MGAGADVPSLAATALGAECGRPSLQEDGKAPIYDLPTAVETALCRNPKTQAAWADVAAQAAQLGVARAAWWPTLSATGQWLHERDSDAGTAAQSRAPTHNVTASLSWLLFDFGARRAGEMAAKLGIEAALANQNLALQTLFASTVKDYDTAMVAWKNVQAATDIQAYALAVLEAARERVRGGVAAVSDQYQAQTAYSQAMFNHSKAEGDWSTAMGMLAIDMGLTPDARFGLADPGDAAPGVAAGVQEIGELLAEAARLHPSLVAARANLQAAQANVTVVSSQGLPSLSVVGRASQTNQPQGTAAGIVAGTSTRQRYIGLQLDVPLFEGFSRVYKVRAAEADVSQKQAALDDKQLQVASDTWSSYQSLKVSAQNIRTAQEMLDSARQAFDAAQMRYRKGVAGILELLSTQTALANAQQQRIQAEASWRSAKVMLAASVGALRLSR